jgi:hypothetical protein
MRMHGYLHDCTSWSGGVPYILNSHEWKCSIISEAFLYCIPFIVQELSLDNANCILDSLMSYQNVINSHFNLLDCWWVDRISDFSCTHYTSAKWTKDDHIKIEETLKGFNDYRHLLSTHKELVLKELIQLGIENDKFENPQKVSPILTKIAQTHGGRYFPTYGADTYEELFVPDILMSDTGNSVSS